MLERRQPIKYIARPRVSLVVNTYIQWLVTTAWTKNAYSSNAMPMFTWSQWGGSGCTQSPANSADSGCSDPAFAIGMVWESSEAEMLKKWC